MNAPTSQFRSEGPPETEEAAPGTNGSRNRARSGSQCPSGENDTTPPGTGRSDETEPIRNPKSEIRNLLQACLRMLKLTGGSQYWTGETQAALEFMESAVAAALQMESPQSGARLEPLAPLCGDPHSPVMGASQIARTGTSAVVPEITASVPKSVQCGLEMAGIEAERWRA